MVGHFRNFQKQTCFQEKNFLNYPCAKLTQYIKHSNKKDTKYWYVINIYEYYVHDIVKILNQYKHPYIYKYGNLWIGIPSIHIKTICNHRVIKALKNNVREVEQVEQNESDSDNDTDSDSDNGTESDSESSDSR